ncbi:unnamed protein product [Closterium sp. NIES-53]
MAAAGHLGHGASTAWKRAFLLAVCVTGIWAAYLTQGVVQENLSTKRFAPDNRRFEHLAFLNLAQSLVCSVVAFLMLKILGTNMTVQPPLLSYWLPGVTNTIGPACGLIALKYISYPAQVLAKSSKMIPVMLAGAIIYGVRYTLPEYVCTLLVAGGVSMFALFKSSSKAMSKLASPNAPLGYTLCFLNLGLDGFTNATQDSITAKYPFTATYHLMLGMNIWGTLYMAIYMFAWPGGGGMAAIDFCRTHPEAAVDVFLFCLCGAVGQNFIFLTINKFGALVNTTITTTRKFMSILISAVWNGNPLTGQQWAGVGMVFAGLSYQIFLKWRKSRGKKKRAGSDLGAAVARKEAVGEGKGEKEALMGNGERKKSR